MLASLSERLFGGDGKCCQKPNVEGMRPELAKSVIHDGRAPASGMEELLNPPLHYTVVHPLGAIIRVNPGTDDSLSPQVHLAQEGEVVLAVEVRGRRLRVKATAPGFSPFGLEGWASLALGDGTPILLPFPPSLVPQAVMLQQQQEQQQQQQQQQQQLVVGQAAAPVPNLLRGGIPGDFLRASCSAAAMPTTPILAPPPRHVFGASSAGESPPRNSVRSPGKGVTFAKEPSVEEISPRSPATASVLAPPLGLENQIAVAVARQNQLNPVNGVVMGVAYPYPGPPNPYCAVAPKSYGDGKGTEGAKGAGKGDALASDDAHVSHLSTAYGNGTAAPSLPGWMMQHQQPVVMPDVKDLDPEKIEALDIRQLEFVTKQLRHLAARGEGTPQRIALLQRAEGVLAEKRKSVAQREHLLPANRRIFGEQLTADFGGGGLEKFHPLHHPAGDAETGGQEEGVTSPGVVATWDRVFEMSPADENSVPTIRGALGSGASRDGEVKTITRNGLVEPRDRLAEEPIRPTSRILDMSSEKKKGPTGPPKPDRNSPVNWLWEVACGDWQDGKTGRTIVVSTEDDAGGEPKIVVAHPIIRKQTLPTSEFITENRMVKFYGTTGELDENFCTITWANGNTWKKI